MQTWIRICACATRNAISATPSSTSPPPMIRAVADEKSQTYYKEHAQDYVIPERVALEYVELDATKLEVNAQRRRRDAEGTLREGQDALRERRAAPGGAHPGQGRRQGRAGRPESRAGQGRSDREGSERRQGLRRSRQAELRGSRFEEPGRRSRLAREGHHRRSVRSRSVRDEQGRHFRSSAERRGVPHHRAARRAARQDAQLRRGQGRTRQGILDVRTRSRLRRKGGPPDRPDLSGSVVAGTRGEGARTSRCRRPISLRAPAAPALRPIRTC